MRQEQLKRILISSPTIRRLMEGAVRLDLPNWYLVAGCITQTVWNSLHGFATDYGIKDCDLIYYDSDISPQAQDRAIRRAKQEFDGFPLEIDAVNEARVHLWFRKYFGYDIQPYRSSEDAIGSWSTLASCVGVAAGSSLSEVKIYAPYGTEDLFNLLLRPNPHSIFRRKDFERKISRWVAEWPKLAVRHD